MKGALMILVLSICLGAAAQDISTQTLRWTSTQATDLRLDSTRVHACTFITRGTTAIDFIQRDGQMRTTYRVSGTQGAWRDVSLNGSFTFLLSRDGHTGRLVIERNAQGTRITLDFSESGPFNIKQRFSVSEVAVQP